MSDIISTSPAPDTQELWKERQDAMQKIARLIVDRCAQQHPKGKAREVAAFEMWMGAMMAANALGQKPLFQQMAIIASMVLSVRPCFAELMKVAEGHRIG